jgi:Protein of unknown function (DUF3750)
MGAALSPSRRGARATFPSSSGATFISPRGVHRPIRSAVNSGARRCRPFSFTFPPVRPHYVTVSWLRALRRRSQKDGFTLERIKRLADDYLPQSHTLHPWPISASPSGTLTTRASPAASSWGCSNDPSHPHRPRNKLRMTRPLSIGLIAVFLVPLVSHALWWQLQEHPDSWADANWSSSGILSPATREPDAVVHVLAGRTGRWKGIFAHHTWIVVKAKGAVRYPRYDVVGWGKALRVDNYPADGRWYGNVPRVLITLKGAEADSAIPEIQHAVAEYPYGGHGSYVIWPGPNSNTFVASVARRVPALAPALLPTAVGKDFAGWPLYAGTSPSHTGLQLSIGGLFGVTLGWVEGLEVNILGLVAGFDLRRPALKLPGWGRIGMAG